MSMTDQQTSDAVHRAGFPRSAIARALCTEDNEDTVEDPVGVATISAVAVADHVTGAQRVTPGPDPARGTVAWWRAYIVELDRRADALVPGWRSRHRHTCGPSAWASDQFGPLDPSGDHPYMPRDMWEHAEWVRSGLTTTEWAAL